MTRCDPCTRFASAWTALLAVGALSVSLGAGFVSTRGMIFVTHDD